MARGVTGSRRTALLWCGLAFAFSPVLADLARALAAEPGHLHTLLPAILMLVLLRRGPIERRPPRVVTGAGLLALGFASQLLGVAADSWSIARTGLPVAMLGVACLDGRPRLALTALAFGLVPVPDSLYELTSPEHESLLAALAARVLAALGWSVELGGPLLQYHGERFELQPDDGGLVTAIVLAELGWYAALRAHAAWSRVALRAAMGALTGLVVQPLLVLFCVASLPLSVPGAGRLLLTHGPWLGVAAFVVLRDGLRPGRAAGSSSQREDGSR